MAKVSTQVARKDYPEQGIVKGQLYYSWQLYKQPKRISATRPRPSQLTGSDKLSRAYQLVEQIEDAVKDLKHPNDLVSVLNDVASDANDLADEYQESLDNMPEGLQQGPTGEDIQNKVEALQSFAGDAEQAASDIEGLDLTDYLEDGREEVKVEAFEDLNEDEQEAFLNSAIEFAEGFSLEI